MAYYNYPNVPGNPNPWYGNYGSNGVSYMREPMPPMPPYPPEPPMPCPPMPCPPMPPMPCPEPHPIPPMPCPKPPPCPEPEPMPPTPCPQPEVDYYTYPINLEEALHLIEEAVMDERHDEMFYECILKMAPAEDRPIIESIRADERKHNQLFRTIYCELTGHVLPDAPKVEFKPPKTYCEGLQEAFFGELAAVEKYRRILYAMQSRRHINMLVEIITDEQKHADKWNYLYTKNECWDKCRPKK